MSSDKYFRGLTRDERAANANNFCKKITDEHMGVYENDLVWKMDCGFKIDIDGPLIHFSSRFYPDDTLNGDICIFIGDEQIYVKHISVTSVDELAEVVSDLHKKWKHKLIQLIQTHNIFEE